MDRKAKKTIATFSAASLLNDIGGDMIKPLWPIFITSTLGAPAAFLGLVDGIGQLLSYLTRFPFGYYSDTWKRKPFVWTGYILSGISRIGYAISGTPVGALVSHIVDRTGKGMRDAPRDAILASHTNKKDRGTAFGTLRAMDNLGATIGPLLAFFLIPLIGIRKLFAIAAIPSLIGALLILFFIREKVKDQAKHLPFLWKELTREYRLVFWISGLFALSWFSVSFLLLYASTKGISQTEIPILYLTYSLSAAVVAYPAGRLSDSIGRRIMLMAAYTLFGLTLAAFAVTTTPSMFYVLFFLYGLHYGMIEAMQGAYISDLVREEHRASALGLFQGLWGLCLLPASVIAGLLWDHVAPWAPFVYGAAIVTIAVLVFAWKVPER